MIYGFTAQQTHLMIPSTWFSGVPVWGESGRDRADVICYGFLC